MKDRLSSIFLKRLAWLLLVGLLVAAIWVTACAMRGPSQESAPPAHTTLAQRPPARASDAAACPVSEADELRSLVVDALAEPRLVPAAVTQRPDETALPPCPTDGDRAARTAPAYQARRSAGVPEPMASASPDWPQLPLEPAERADHRGFAGGQAFEPLVAERPDDQPPSGAETFLPSALSSLWSAGTRLQELLEFRAPLEPNELAGTPLSAAESDLPRESRGGSGPQKIGRARGVVCARLPTYTRRSRDLELIAREADMHTRRGFALAGRGACFSARAEFVAALRLLAQALDAEYQTRLHSRALSAGLTAVKEAGDFIPTGSRLEADLDLSSLIEAHRTPVLQGAPSESLAPLVALRSYFTFAQEQLATAAGREMAGSMALHGLGNVHRALARQRGGLVQAAEPKAMVFYQAALLVFPDNYMASNELGVLLAQAGRHEAARTALEHSVSVCEQPTGWYNLAVVYRQLGQTEWSWQAYHRSRAIRGREAAGEATSSPASGQQVRWIDPGAFAESGGGPPLAGSPTARPPWSGELNTPQAGPAAGRHVAQSSVSSRPDERR